MRAGAACRARPRRTKSSSPRPPPVLFVDLAGAELELGDPAGPPPLGPASNPDKGRHRETAQKFCSVDSAPFPCGFCPSMPPPALPHPLGSPPFSAPMWVRINGGSGGSGGSFSSDAGAPRAYAREGAPAPAPAGGPQHGLQTSPTSPTSPTGGKEEPEQAGSVYTLPPRQGGMPQPGTPANDPPASDASGPPDLAAGAEGEGTDELL